MKVDRPQKIIYVQAPCRADGVIDRDLQEESKEGTCRCPSMPEGCCVDGFGILVPKILRTDYVSRQI